MIDYVTLATLLRCYKDVQSAAGFLDQYKGRDPSDSRVARD